jgi:hypothetical protein
MLQLGPDAAQGLSWQQLLSCPLLVQRLLLLLLPPLLLWGRQQQPQVGLPPV